MIIVMINQAIGENYDITFGKQNWQKFLVNQWLVVLLKVRKTVKAKDTALTSNLMV